MDHNTINQIEEMKEAKNTKMPRMLLWLHEFNESISKFENISDPEEVINCKLDILDQSRHAKA